MLTKIRKLIIITLTAVMTLVPVCTFAEDGSIIDDLGESSTIGGDTAVIQSDGYYTWEIESKTLVNNQYYGSYATMKSVTVTAADAPQDIKVNFPRTYKAQSRGVFKRYKVKQQRYYHIDGSKTKIGNPVYCYVNKYQYEDHRLYKS